MVKKKKNVFLNRTAIALTNALQSPNILDALTQHGIDERHIKQLQSQLREAQQMGHQYRDASAEAKAATQSLHDVQAEAKKMYRQHVQLSRVALSGNLTLLDKMDLNGARKRTLADWMTQAINFYRHAATIKETLAPYNITAKEISEMQKLLNRMVELQTLQFQLKGKMQVVSEQKKQVFATLRKSMSKFYRIARIALETDPQQMEVLGLVVKAQAV